MAWQMHDDDRCPGCGNPLSDTTDFDKRMGWQVEAVTCHGCKARSAKSDQASEGTFQVVTAKDGHG